jgi:GrpB protein
VSRSYDGWRVIEGALPAASLPATSVGLTFTPWRAGIGVGTCNGPNRTGDAAPCDAEDGTHRFGNWASNLVGPPTALYGQQRIVFFAIRAGVLGHARHRARLGHDLRQRASRRSDCDRGLRPDAAGSLCSWQVALRAALGPTAIRIEHIGSTSVPGLAAKPIIDVQVSVTDLTDEDAYARYVTRFHNPLCRDQGGLRVVTDSDSCLVRAAFSA